MNFAKHLKEFARLSKVCGSSGSSAEPFPAGTLNSGTSKTELVDPLHPKPSPPLPISLSKLETGESSLSLHPLSRQYCLPVHSPPRCLSPLLPFLLLFRPLVSGPLRLSPLLQEPMIFLNPNLKTTPLLKILPRLPLGARSRSSSV